MIIALTLYALQIVHKPAELVFGSHDYNVWAVQQCREHGIEITEANLIAGYRVNRIEQRRHRRNHR